MATSAIGNQKTIQQIIDDSAKKTSDRNTGDLGKDDFLNLLVTQLKYQDPMNPLDDKEFIGQMAQFSALEQMQNLNSSMSQSQAYSLVGKYIKASYMDEATKEMVNVEGDVASVKVSGGKTFVVVGGKEVPVDKVSEVTEGTAQRYGDINQYANIIGMQAKGFVYNKSNGELVTVSGLVKSIQLGTNEDYAVVDDVNVRISGVADGSTSTDPNYVKDYLAKNVGKEIDVFIKDAETGGNVAVTAKLEKYTVNADGSIDAVLDDLNIPVASIHNLTPGQQTSNEEALLNEILDQLKNTSSTTTQNSSTTTGSSNTSVDNNGSTDSSGGSIEENQ